jgi:hypothetical protein
MACKYGTAVYNHILAWFASAATVGILTALDTDTVIASIKLRVNDKGILT